MIRSATLDDVQAIMDLEREDIAHPWEEAAISNLITSDTQVALVYENEASVVIGYVGAMLIVGEAEIGNVCVSSRARRQGIASQLLASLDEYLISQATYKVFLEVEDTNAPAIGLYEKHGYSKCGVRKDYYGPNRHAFLYSKDYN